MDLWDVHLRFKKWMSIFKLLCDINHLILKQSKNSNNTILLLTICVDVLSSGLDCGSHYKTKIIVFSLSMGDLVLLQFYYLMQ